MGLLNKLAGFAGESVRIKRTANQEEQLDPSGWTILKITRSPVM